MQGLSERKGGLGYLPAREATSNRTNSTSNDCESQSKMLSEKEQLHHEA